MAESRAAVPVLIGMMLLTGCANTLLTKYQDQQCVADCHTKHAKLFEQPVIQTLQMFIGESGCWLVVLAGYLLRRLRKTPALQDIAYQRVADEEDEERRGLTEEEGYDNDGAMTSSAALVDPSTVHFVDSGNVAQRKPLTGWKITILALPAICDICATTLMNAGLLFVAASIYQMTRGALVLFVGLFSVIFLKRHLSGWKWASLFIVVAGVAVVGLAGALEQEYEHPEADRMDLTRRALESHTAAETILGILMISGGQVFAATQFVLEESIMEKYSMDPIQVVGWEGVFGFLVTLIGIGVLHGTIGSTTAGQGGYFDAREGFYQVFHNRAIAVTSILIMISIGGFNFFGLSVTRIISATSRSTIDTCRTLFIWVVSLGLGWESFKWLQVVGFALLVYGTGLFNEIIRPPTVAFLRRRRSAPASVFRDGE